MKFVDYHQRVLEVLLLSMLGTVKVDWMLISMCPPASHAKPVGIVLLDPIANKLFFRLKTTLNSGNKDIDSIWEQFGEDLDLRATERGATEVFEWLESTFSTVFRVSELQTALTQNVFQALDSLYEDHVEKSRIITHSA